MHYQKPPEHLAVIWNTFLTLRVRLWSSSSEQPGQFLTCQVSYLRGPYLAAVSAGISPVEQPYGKSENGVGLRKRKRFRGVGELGTVRRARERCLHQLAGLLTGDQAGRQAGRQASRYLPCLLSVKIVTCAVRYTLSSLSEKFALCTFEFLKIIPIMFRIAYFVFPRMFGASCCGVQISMMAHLSRLPMFPNLYFRWSPNQIERRNLRTRM